MSQALQRALLGLGGLLAASSAWAMPPSAPSGATGGQPPALDVAALTSHRALPPVGRTMPLLVLVQDDERRALEDRRRALEDERRQLEDQRRQLEDARRQIEDDLGTIPPAADAVVEERRAALAREQEEATAGMAEQRAAEDEQRRAARAARIEEDNNRVAEQRRREDEERARQNTERALQEEREVADRRRQEDEERTAAAESELNALSQEISTELGQRRAQLEQQSGEIADLETNVLQALTAVEQELSAINRQLRESRPSPPADEAAAEPPAVEPGDTPAGAADEAEATEAPVPPGQDDIQRVLARPDEPIMVGGVPLEDDVRVFVATQNVNIRAAPDLDAPRLSTVAGGTRLIVVSEEDGWYGIRLIGGDVAYASARFLRPYQP